MQGRIRENLAPPLTLAWKFETPQEEGKRRPPIEASPVIAGGQVFVGSQDGNFYALDLESGTQMWSFRASGPIIAPAAVDGDRVFFGDTYGTIYALSTADGKERWHFAAEGKIEGGVNFLKEGNSTLIFVGSHDSNLYCLDANTGAEKWKQETGNYVVATPSLVRSPEGSIDIVFGGCDGMLHVIPAGDAPEGKRENREIEIGAYVANTSAVADGICYVAHNGGEVMAIRIATGETLWTTKTGVEYTASPALDETLLYVAGPDKKLVAYRRDTGQEVWSFVTPRALSSSPIICGDTVWQCGMDGRIYAIRSTDGNEEWKYELGAKIKSSPAASREFLVVCGEDGIVYGFKK